jgi:hypothetical protein
MVFWYQFSCSAHSGMWLLACCIRSVQNIRELSWRNRFRGIIRGHPHQVTDDHGLRPCAPCGVVAGLIQQRSGVHIRRHRRRMLFDLLAIVLLECQNYFAILTFLASVAVHVCLERTGTGESLVTDLALVLLLAARRNLRAELTHH